MAKIFISRLAKETDRTLSHFSLQSTAVYFPASLLLRGQLQHTHKYLIQKAGTTNKHTTVPFQRDKKDTVREAVIVVPFAFEILFVDRFHEKVIRVEILYFFSKYIRDGSRHSVLLLLLSIKPSERTQSRNNSLTSTDCGKSIFIGFILRKVQSCLKLSRVKLSPLKAIFSNQNDGKHDSKPYRYRHATTKRSTCKQTTDSRDAHQPQCHQPWRF